MDGSDFGMKLAASIDWLTVTCKSPRYRQDMFNLAGEMLEESKKMGEPPKPWKFLDYLGQQIPGFRWGTRQGDDIAVCSGEYADGIWRRFVQVSENCSRIDLAVTARLEEPMLNVARGVYEALTSTGGAPADSRRMYTLIHRTDAAQTLYVGARSNCQFGRLYDKGMELPCGMPAGVLWRYEVEFKKPLSIKVSRSLLECRNSANLKDVVLGTVHDWFFARHVPPIFNKLQGQVGLHLVLEAEMTSDEITLQWLGHQVAPAVNRLVRSGKADKVSQALGVHVTA